MSKKTTTKVTAIEMMQKGYDLKKLSKKLQKEYFNSKRNNWGEIDPRQKTIPDKRRKLKEKAEQKYSA